MPTSKNHSIEFKAKNVKGFIGWIKRFSSIDKSLLLEIDQSSQSFIAKTYNDIRSVVKMSTIKFDEAGLIFNSSTNKKRIKMGIFNISHLTKIMEQFNDTEFDIVISFQEILGDNNDQFAGEKIVFKNKSLKMSVDCSSLNIFKYISDDLFKNQISFTDSVGMFNLLKSNIEKLHTLNTLDDSDENCMVFKIIDKKVFVSGKTYELLVCDNDSQNLSLPIFKEQFTNIDIENYTVNIGEDRIVFNSNDSNTTMVISKTEDK